MKLWEEIILLFLIFISVSIIAIICALQNTSDTSNKEKELIHNEEDEINYDPPSSYEIGCDHDWMCVDEDSESVIIYCKKCDTYDVAMKGVKTYE